MTGRLILAKYIQQHTTQAALADEAACSESHLSLYLKGEREISVGLAKRLSTVTGIPAGDLLDIADASSRK